MADLLERPRAPIANPLTRHAEELGACPACLGRALRPVLRQASVPANSCLMLDTPDEARAYPRGAIHLLFCAACGFVFNDEFDPKLTEYSERYEPTQGYSATFRRFHSDLAGRVAQCARLRSGATVVEVGSGQGEFLHLLCRQASARGIGFDPCFSPDRADVVVERAEDVSLRGEFFADDSVQGLRADLLVSKMTLEHIPAPARFARAAAQLARQSAPGMRLFIQVPDCQRIFADGAFEDIYYEHCNYFTSRSLVALFARHGFAVEEVSREYAGQYLALQARYAGAPQPGPGRGDLARLSPELDHFAAVTATAIARWAALVEARRAAGRSVVVWGSGSKGVSFLGAIGGGAGVTHVVDINPHRQGRFMVGTGHPIVAPAALAEIRPATVIVMNPVYRAEVAMDLQRLGIAPELLTL